MRSRQNMIIVILASISFIFIVLCCVVIYGALSEKPSSHEKDFQTIKEVVIKQEVNTVEEGIQYASDEAKHWRKDAIMTAIFIASTGKDEINANVGKITYEFQFPFVNDDNPSGIIFVTINTDTNSIEFVSASHDEIDNKRNVPSDNLIISDEEISDYYDKFIGDFGEKELYSKMNQSIQCEVRFDIVYCTIKVSDDGKEIISKHFQIDKK